jgi:zinc protease
MDKMRWIILLALVAVIQVVEASEIELPVDPGLRIGRLENGLTYYIRHNEQPKDRAEFWLVQNTGSLVEEDDERGLAHFIEHIAFHGTRNFPGIYMVDILENNGVSGSDINASTNFDDTRFQISNVPTERVELLDTVLLMLKDLSCELNFDDRAIEEERGVIQEEWRMRADETMRLYENTLPILLSGSRYASRLPIGDMSVIRNVTREKLLSFYHRWYCPQRQAVVIVGDIDVDSMENRIKRIMSQIPMCDSPDADAKLKHVPDHNGVNYALHTDPEASRTMIFLMFEREPTPWPLRNTMTHLHNRELSELIERMLNARINEMTRTQASPLDYADVVDGQFLAASSRNALIIAASAKEGRAFDGLDSLITHVARAMQHGFTTGELERAKRDEIAACQYIQSGVGKLKSHRFVEECIYHFEKGGYIPGVFAEMQLSIDEARHITLDEVNDYLRSITGKDNVSVMISGPQSMTGKSLYPTSQDVIAHFNRIINTPQSPYIDLTDNDKLLLPNEPHRGSIIDESYEHQTGITTMTLSNGATVRLKPTSFKNNEVLFNAFSLGGEWAYGDTAADVNVRLMDQVIEECALGGHTINQLNRMMSGRQLEIYFILNDVGEELSGSCNSADLETLLQLCYLYFTDVSLDEEAFQGVKTRLRSQLSQESNNPKMIYSDSIASTLFQGNPVYRNLSPEEVDQLDGERVLELYRQRVANAGDYTFSIVGAFTVDEVRPFIMKYLASLPDNGKRETYGSGNRSTMATGMVDNYFKVPMLNPKSSIYVSIMGDKKYSYDDEFMVSLVADAVGTALVSYLRHAKHATYDVASNGYMSMYHKRWMINYEFETSTTERDSMLVYADQIVNAIFNHGVSEDLFNKMKEMSRQKHEVDLSTNDYWLKALRMKALGVDIVGGFDHILPSLTLEHLNNYIAALRPHTRLRIVMN